MARTIDEIKADLQEQYMQSPIAEALYGLPRDEDGVVRTRFDEYFSKVAVERLLIYMVAYCTHFLERLVDTVVEDLTALVERQAPGRCDWYARKLREFQYGDDDVLNEAGEYDTVIEEHRIVKHAVAVDDYASSRRLILKVAGEDGGGKRQPLTDEEAERLEWYISQIKYAGVPTRLINSEGDTFNCQVTVWYDPVLSAETVQGNCADAIKAYIENLPFNGEYSNMALTDALQRVAGVKVVGTVTAQRRAANEDITRDIPDKERPFAGYYQVGNLNLDMQPYE